MRSRSATDRAATNHASATAGVERDVFARNRLAEGLPDRPARVFGQQVRAPRRAHERVQRADVVHRRERVGRATADPFARRGDARRQPRRLRVDEPALDRLPRFVGVQAFGREPAAHEVAQPAVEQVEAVFDPLRALRAPLLLRDDVDRRGDAVLGRPLLALLAFRLPRGAVAEPLVDVGRPHSAREQLRRLRREQQEPEDVLAGELAARARTLRGRPVAERDDAVRLRAGSLRLAPQRVVVASEARPSTRRREFATRFGRRGVGCEREDLVDGRRVHRSATGAGSLPDAAPLPPAIASEARRRSVPRSGPSAPWARRRSGRTCGPLGRRGTRAAWRISAAVVLGRNVPSDAAHAAGFRRRRRVPAQTLRREARCRPPPRGL
jgi:hypothetical protein